MSFLVFSFARGFINCGVALGHQTRCFLVTLCDEYCVAYRSAMSSCYNITLAQTKGSQEQIKRRLEKQIVYYELTAERQIVQYRIHD